MRFSNIDIEVADELPRSMFIGDGSIEYLAEDELLEVTTLNFRIRKRILRRKNGVKQISVPKNCSMAIKLNGAVNKVGIK
jgi:predicted membrane GTPase involved in stress response